MVIKREKLAYFAGFFDGEGSISINSLPNYRNPKWSKLYGIWVQITNSSLEPLKEIKEIFGGSICLRSGSGRTPKNKKYWKLCITTRKAYIFLKAILPYVIIKKNAILCALEFHKICVRKTYPRNVYTPIELQNKREQFKNRLEEINKSVYLN